MPAARLRIFGGTPRGSEGYRDRCERLAAELGLGESVSFEGRVANIRDAYAAGHIVVLSSISEGFPYTLDRGDDLGPRDRIHPGRRRA